MRDLAADVVKNVRLRDSVGSVGPKPAHNRTKISEEVAIQRAQRAAGEVVCFRAVVREQGIGMLQEGDQDKPVIDPDGHTIRRCMRE